MVGRYLAAASVLATVATVRAACDATPQCKYFFDAGTELWKWDFSRTCTRGSADYSYVVPGRTDNLKYLFQPCGTIKAECPSAVYSTGSIVQSYEGDAGEVCQVLGYGPPIYHPWPSTNGYEPAGVNITYRGEPPVLGKTDCGFDEKTLAVKSRKAVLSIACDYSVYGFTVDRVLESPTCYYNMFVRSRFACPSTCNNA